MKAFLAGITLVITGCATEDKFRDHLQTWMGHDVNDVIMAYGPPSSTYDMPNGNKMYTWLQGGRSVAGYNPYSHMAWAATIYCKITMTADPHGTLLQYQYEGNQCVSR